MVKTVEAGEWKETVLEATKPVIVDFWHEQCIWCQRLNPIFEELAHDFDTAVFTKLDIRASHDNMHLGAEYGIMGTPTLKIFCAGREVGSVVGYREKPALKEELDRILASSKTCLSQSTDI